MAGGGGGAWKVAYADFVTAMMAFFMVMWLVGQDQEKRTAVAEYFQDPWARSRVNQNRSRNPSMKEQKAGKTPTEKKFDGSNPREVPHENPEAPNAKQPKLITVRSPERTTVGTVVTFEVNSTEISEEGKRKLKLIVPQLLGLSNKIDIRGHVSPQMAATGGKAEMRDLSYKRGSAVLDYLAELGIQDERMRINVAGPHEPLVIETPDATSDKNSRVEVFLLSETVQQLKPAAN
jgi:chemotaxis protein MotB